jgi:hypothetical protein
VFFKGSRYEQQPTYNVTLPDGTEVVAVRLPVPKSRPLVGYHRVREGQRLDHLAFRYLADATAMWKICEANNATVPGALAVRDLVGIPPREER